MPTHIGVADLFTAGDGGSDGEEVLVKGYHDGALLYELNFEAWDPDAVNGEAVFELPALPVDFLLFESTGEFNDDYALTFIAGAGSGDDVLTGTNQRDTLLGGAGDDDLDGGRGNDYLDGGAGDDNLLGGAQRDTLLGGDGDDVLDGGAGRDKLFGDAGDDVLSYDSDDDILDGGAGNDTLLIGDEGTVNLDNVANIEHVDLTDGDAGDRLTLSAADLLSATDAGDLLFVDGDSGDSVVLEGMGWARVAEAASDPLVDYSFDTWSDGGATININALLDTDVADI